MNQEKNKNLALCDAFIRDFQSFETQLNGQSTTQFHKERIKAISTFAELGFPTTRDEKWKYTNISSFLKKEFSLAASSKVDKSQIEPFLFDGMQKSRLVFVNGIFSAELSSLDENNGVVAKSLEAAHKENKEVVEKYLAQHLIFSDQPFAALNTAFARDGAFIFVPRNTIAAQPLHLLFISSSDSVPFHSHPRNLIVLAESSELQLVESRHFVGDQEQIYFNNFAAEIIVGANAKLDLVRIQDESKSAFQFSSLQAKVDRDAHFSFTGVDLGGSISRNDTNIEFTGENAGAQLLGFYYANGTQLLDNHTFIDHAVPHCNSDELFKGFMDDQSHGVFNGAVLVRPDAQKTNAFQQNQAILISKDATVDAKPELEIFADDVLCSHGATIGEIQEEHLFYLRSRGIGEEMARAMLHIAFANDIFERIKIESVREKLEDEIIKRFSE
ncbi:MAG: Fe-S cluster assembly protein SufD [Deferribacteres bacterium]|nr:Fe-S cluster assembly protein SufD [candidate division KSB1 bacterium]MCB9503966.1 Fe-S cluster assembly protein SufD [Deferribacteres bacterium]